LQAHENGVFSQTDREKYFHSLKLPGDGKAPSDQHATSRLETAIYELRTTNRADTRKCSIFYNLDSKSFEISRLHTAMAVNH